jgi:hypothetical protein
MGMTTVLRKYAHMRFGNFFPLQEDLQFFLTIITTSLRSWHRTSSSFMLIYPSQLPGDVEMSCKFYADGIHPNNAGYDLVTEILYDSLWPTVTHPDKKNQSFYDDSSRAIISVIRDPQITIMEAH